MQGLTIPTFFSVCQNVRSVGNCITEAATPWCLRPPQYPGQLRKHLMFVSKVTRHSAYLPFIPLEKRGEIILLMCSTPILVDFSDKSISLIVQVRQKKF